MDLSEIFKLPFLTRKMLSFEHATAFALQVVSQASVSSTITIRGATREGVFTLSQTLAADGSQTTSTFRLPDIPIWISVIDTEGNSEQGDCFITVNLLINDDIAWCLVSGLVYAQKGITWPNNTMEDLKPGHGRIKVVLGSDPAAGAEISETVPNGRAWKIHTLRLNLVTAVAAAARRVHVVITSAGLPILDVFSDIDQAASENRMYSVANFGGTDDSADDNDILIPFPKDLILPENTTITTQTTNLQAADNWAAPNLFIEEFFELP